MEIKSAKNGEASTIMSIASACWTCQNAVPNKEGTRGCSWSRRLKPVEGWNAVETQEGRYKVIDCPEYISD